VTRRRRVDAYPGVFTATVADDDDHGDKDFIGT
jgi:hypothetical protein